MKPVRRGRLLSLEGDSPPFNAGASLKRDGTLARRIFDAIPPRLMRGPH